MRGAPSEPTSTPAPEKAVVRASVIDVRSGETRWMMTLPVSARRLRGVADTVARACALAMDLDPRAEEAADWPVTL